MADIELVIKIPEETYKDIQSHDWKNVGKWYSEEWKAIHNGIPLPKGHGDLIDTDAFIKQESCCGYIEDMDIDYFKQNIPIIIKADKESE